MFKSEKIKTLKEENKILREALEVYADSSNWTFSKDDELSLRLIFITPENKSHQYSEGFDMAKFALESI